MMKKGIFACLVGGLLSLVGCTPKKSMPAGELVKLSFTRNEMTADNQFEGCVEQDSTGVFILSAMKEEYGPLFEKRIDAEMMKKFRQIIEEERMYAYKESYEPLTNVNDGSMWHFNAVFSDGSMISSHGNNASPDGDGLSRIKALMMELVKDGAPKADTDGFETLCFSGKMGENNSVVIAFDYHVDNETSPAGYIYYPKAKNPAPILIVGDYLQGENVFVFNEYQPDGTISGTLSLKVDGFERADGPYIAEGEWTNPKTGKSFDIKDMHSYKYDHGTTYTPEWFDHPALQRADPDHFGKHYSYKQWNDGYGDYMGGDVTFHAAGKNQVHFSICNSPGNIAEGKSSSDRPAVLHGNSFTYDNVNECGYGFKCQIYDKYLVISSTTDYDTFSCFGANTTFEAVYVKVEE